MVQAAIDRVAQYVSAYNKAIEERDTARAIDMGRLAVRDASDELKKPNLIESHRQYYQRVVTSIGEFLANPSAAVAQTAASGGIGGDSVEKIKSTDWFSAPIPNLGMKDIAGLKNVRDEFVVNVFAPMSPEYGDIYRRYRGDERGLAILLYGPPGTGKTHVVRCLAGEMKCKIAVVQVKDVMANLVGDGAKIISEIFEQAKKHERCIIFLDEIDAIAASREDEDSRHTKEQLTTLLTNMDGFTSQAKPGQIRIVIAATNRPWILDSAVKRGGRFSTQLYVPLPDRDAREYLIRRALGQDPRVKDRVEVPCAPDVTVEWLVERTEGFAGADIKAICRQAVGKPMKREILSRVNGAHVADCVTRADFDEVLDNYINSITNETLMQFDAYTMNMEVGLEYRCAKCKQLIKAYYSNYMLAKTGDARTYRAVQIERFEDVLFWECYESGLIERELGGKYDLSFLHELYGERKRST